MKERRGRDIFKRFLESESVRECSSDIYALFTIDFINKIIGLMFFEDLC